ncbi:MAG TPA: hypothetical protein VNF28_03370 [Candidatus Binataceae bacterium]|nr:hypothetical protein [Candidatus Binataceae bacterium]
MSTPQRRLRPASIAVYVAFLAMTTLMAGCQAAAQQYHDAVAGGHNANLEQDRLRLMIYTGDLGVPYQELGDLSYTDPLNGETIDIDHINEKLRQMAIARWGQQADAIIHVTTKVGDTTISVTGEAVRLKDPCSGCRHNFSSPQA